MSAYFLFESRGIFDSRYQFLISKARSADEIAERILFPAPPMHPNCLCVISKDEKK